MIPQVQRQKRERKHWDALSSKYDDVQLGKHHTLYKKVIKTAARSLKKGDAVLEIGCGTDIVTLGISPHVGKVIGYDLSDQMVEMAERKALENGITTIEFKVGDAYCLPEKDESFDAVLVPYVLDIVEEPQLILKEAYRLLKANGVLIVITDFRKSSWWRLWVSSILRFVLRRQISKPDFRSRPTRDDLRKLITQFKFCIQKEVTWWVSGNSFAFYSVAQKR